MDKVECIIFEFKDQTDFEDYSKGVKKIQEEVNPEISMMVYNAGSESKAFNEKNEKIVSELTEEYFIEFIQEDLSKPELLQQKEGSSPG